MLAVLAVTNGCGKSNDNQIASAPPVSSCQAGYAQSQYGCLPQGYCAAGQVQYQNSCITSTNIVTNANRLTGSLAITNSSVFEQYLASVSGCTNSNGWLWRNSRCSLISGSGTVTIDGPQNPVDGTMYTMTVSGAYGYGGYPIQVVYKAAHANQGFTLQDGSVFNYPTGRIRADVASGSINAGNFNVVLSYKGRDFATSLVQRQ